MNLADIHAERPLRTYIVCSIARRASSASRTLARGWRRTSGSTRSRQARLWPDDESFDELSRQRIITCHFGAQAPDDIAVAVYFLLEDARYVTGGRDARCRRRPQRRDLSVSADALTSHGPRLATSGIVTGLRGVSGVARAMLLAWVFAATRSRPLRSVRWSRPRPGCQRSATRVRSARGDAASPTIVVFSQRLGRRLSLRIRDARVPRRPVRGVPHYSAG